MPIELLIGLGVVAILVAAMYNSLVSKKNEIENAVGGVHSYLKKRADLIPSLVATVKQYAAHETKLLTDLTQARASLQGGHAGGDNLPNADSMMSQVFGRVIAIAESYPDLKANQNFLNLQASLNEIEGQLSAARRTYNSAVVVYNTAIESIPTNVIASALGYKRKPVFQVSVTEAERPDIAKLFGQTGS